MQAFDGIEVTSISNVFENKAQNNIDVNKDTNLYNFEHDSFSTKKFGKNFNILLLIKAKRLKLVL